MSDRSCPATMAFPPKSHRDRSAAETLSRNSNRASSHSTHRHNFRPAVTLGNRFPDGLHHPFKGLRAIRSSGPTACIRPANLVYRAPSSLHGDASRLLRQILRVSSPAEPPRADHEPPQSLAVIKSSKLIRQPIKPCFQGDSILDRFLLNNGGYLDDSDSESEAEDEVVDRPKAS